MNKKDKNSLDQLTLSGALFGTCTISILNSLGSSEFFWKFIIYSIFALIAVYCNIRHLKKLEYFNNKPSKMRG